MTHPEALPTRLILHPSRLKIEAEYLAYAREVRGPFGSESDVCSEPPLNLCYPFKRRKSEVSNIPVTVWSLAGIMVLLLMAPDALWHQLVSSRHYRFNKPPLEAAFLIHSGNSSVKARGSSLQER